MSWTKLRAALSRPGVQAGVLLVAAVLIRVWRWGNPAIHVDEQFYLLVGERMLHGALPFIDIWDRKPIGLFLIYAAIRLLGGRGIVEYQIVATLFAAATAVTITRTASRLSGPVGAVSSGLAYLLWLDMFGGEGGQSPVFYNLFMAVAGLLTLRAISERPGSSRRLFGLGVAALMICGLAIQIKYTALFEGAFFGLVFVGQAWRISPRPLPRAGEALVWLLCGTVPTGLAYLYYASLGASDVFIFANFTSVFQRAPATATELLDRLGTMVKYGYPLLIGAGVAFWHVDRTSNESMRIAGRFVAGWALAAIAGLLLFGSYFEHYALPVLVPLTIGCAPLLADTTIGLTLVAPSRRLFLPVGLVVMLFGVVQAHSVIRKNVAARGKNRQIQALVDAIQPRLQGCMFVYDGEPILYYLAGSCLPSRYAFPDHLNNKIETGAIGVDPDDEVRRILASKPHLVVSTDKPGLKTNRSTWAIMADALAADYRPVFSVQIGTGERIVYERK